MKESTKRHLVACPHCGRDVLDHMTVCPFCGGELTPAGYRETDPEKLARIRKISNLILIPIAVVIVAYLLYMRFFG